MQIIYLSKNILMKRESCKKKKKKKIWYAVYRIMETYI